MSLSLVEQETVILWNREEPTAMVNTYDPALIRKLDAMSRIDPAVVVYRRGDNWAEYRIPKKWVKVVKPRQLSEEKLEELRERAKTLSQRRKEEKDNAE